MDASGRKLRFRKRHLLIVGLLAAVLAAMPVAGGLAATPTIGATEDGIYGGFIWSPSTAEIGPGESVNFKNETSVLHAVDWDSGPETPECTGVPSSGQGNWSGSCAFAQAGTYAFVCPVHPSEMTGAITVNGPAAPVVSTGNATLVNDTEATLNGSVDPSGQATTYHFKYGTTAGYGEQTGEVSAGEGTTSEPAAATVTGLSPATTYHFQIVATNASGTTTGADRTFTTSGPPTAVTQPATAVGDTEATLAGSVNPRGHATTYYFNYGTTSAYGQKAAEKSAGSGTSNVSVSAPLTGLSPETTYHFQLVAENSSGTTPGADRTFTTPATPPPPPPPSLPSPPPASVPPLSTTTTPPPPAEERPALGSRVTVVARRSGSRVRVHIRVLPAGNGGRLRVVLRMKERRSKRAIAGRLVRRRVSSGKHSLSVRLNPRARRALRRRHRLALQVRIKLVPVTGNPIVLTRSVVVGAPVRRPKTRALS